MPDDEKKTRKRKPAKFVITKWSQNSIDDSSYNWFDQQLPDGCDPPDSTDACLKIIKDHEWTGKFRIIQAKRSIEVKVEQTPTTTITEIE